jgi:hypothetical protein
MPALPAHSLTRQTVQSLQRLRPRLRTLFSDESQWATFSSRLDTHYPDLFQTLLGVYGTSYDFF